MFASLEAKLVAGVIALALIAAALWYLHHDGYEAGKNEVQVLWDADTLKRDEAQTAALIAYADRIKHAQEQHDHDQSTIDNLHDVAGRVRIHLPACPDNAAAPGKNPDGAAGLLPNRVDQRFAEFQARVGGLVARCDQLNIDAIRANAAH